MKTKFYLLKLRKTNVIYSLVMLLTRFTRYGGTVGKNTKFIRMPKKKKVLILDQGNICLFLNVIIKFYPYGHFIFRFIYFCFLRLAITL